MEVQIKWRYKLNGGTNKINVNTMKVQKYRGLLRPNYHSFFVLTVSQLSLVS